MHIDQFAPGAKRASHFYSFLTFLVIAGICLVLVPDGALEAMNISGLLPW